MYSKYTIKYPQGEREVYIPDGKQTCRIIRYVKKGHMWEKKINKLISDYCSKDKVSIDVGANLGIHTLSMCEYSKSVIAIEPQNIIRECLSLTLSNYDNIMIYDKLISNKIDDEIQFIQDGTGRSRIPIEGQKYKKNHWEIITKKTTTLDELARGYEIGCIKIDVEGHEFNVLEGAKELIKKNKPVIFIEVFPDRVNMLNEWASANNYHIEKISKEADYLLRPFIYIK